MALRILVKFTQQVILVYDSSNGKTVCSLTLRRRSGDGEGAELRREVVGDWGLVSLCPLSLRCLWVRISPRLFPTNPLSTETPADSENTDSSSETCSFSSSRLIFCKSDTAETPESVSNWIRSERLNSEHRHRMVSRRCRS